MTSMPEVGSPTKRPVLLWWGRSDVNYSRNAIIRQCFESLGWQIVDYRPWLSRFAHWQARLPLTLPNVSHVDLIWVPCFRQRDIAAARNYAARTSTPLCADPLISTYDKQVDERQKFEPDSAAASRLRQWESELLAGADRVVVDTHEHAQYFADTLSVDPARLTVIPVSADESMFKPSTPPTFDGPLRVLFYGSFLVLQGPQFIIQAAKLLQARDVHFSMLGDGPLRAQCVADAGASAQLSFEPWIHYQRLPQRIAQAHLLLGVFGTSPKAGRVIPNKVYQSLASGRPVVTRDSLAYPAPLRCAEQDGLRFIEAGSAEALAAAIEIFVDEPQQLVRASLSARRIYQQNLSNEQVRYALCALLESLKLPAFNEQRARHGSSVPCC